VHWFTVVSLLEILHSILFFEHFDFESYVVNISSYCFHTIKPANALMLKLYLDTQFVVTLTCFGLPVLSSGT
jgi:hypothetical protein